MNKVIIYGMMPVLLLFFSCNEKDNVTLSELAGEWTVIELNGQSVTAIQQPFIGFTQEMNIYGNYGCNRLTGKFELSPQSTQMAMSKVSTTMTPCPDMELETDMLEALVKIRNVKHGETNRIVLCDSVNKPLIILERRCYEIPLDDLQGKWNIEKIYGESVSDTIGESPFIAFNITSKQICGNAGGCWIAGRFETESSKRNSITFLDIKTEQTILNALKEVRTFGLLVNGHVGLYTSDSAIAFELVKIE